MNVPNVMKYFSDICKNSSYQIDFISTLFVYLDWKSSAFQQRSHQSITDTGIQQQQYFTQISELSRNFNSDLHDMQLHKHCIYIILMDLGGLIVHMLLLGLGKIPLPVWILCVNFCKMCFVSVVIYMIILLGGSKVYHIYKWNRDKKMCWKLGPCIYKLNLMYMHHCMYIQSCVYMYNYIFECNRDLLYM